MDSLYLPSIITIVDNLFSYPYLRLVNLSLTCLIGLLLMGLQVFISFNVVYRWIYRISYQLMLFIFVSSACVGFGMTLPHRKAAVFTARHLELLEVVQLTLLYLHPDLHVHSFLSPLPYQVSNYFWWLIGVSMVYVFANLLFFILSVCMFLLRSIQLLLQRCLQFDMPSLFAFDLIRESDLEFETRTGWTYHAGSPIVLPSQLLNVGQP